MQLEPIREARRHCVFGRKDSVKNMSAYLVYKGNKG